jgi:hypothetical protein
MNTSGAMSASAQKKTQKTALKKRRKQSKPLGEFFTSFFTLWENPSQIKSSVLERISLFSASLKEKLARFSQRWKLLHFRLFPFLSPVTRRSNGHTCIRKAHRQNIC